MSPANGTSDADIIAIGTAAGEVWRREVREDLERRRSRRRMAAFAFVAVTLGFILLVGAVVIVKELSGGR